jgi:phosphopantetheinyl transferase
MLRVRIAAIDPLVAVAGEDAPAWLGASERRRWTTLAPARRREFLAARRLLREVLAQATGQPGHRWQVSAEPGMAPVAALADGQACPAPNVSIAHRLGWAAVAAGPAEGGKIGVDVECEGPRRGDPAERAALMLPADELARWHALADARRAPALMRAWVAREAWFKAREHAAAWDFRRIACDACEPAQANVRIWEAGPTWVALCTGDAVALEAAPCDGWPEPAASSYWRVRPLAR